jgi:hypothetical protein
MVSFPAANWLALTVNDAVAVPPEPVRLPVPSDALPSVKETEPVGVPLPLAAFTVAVSAVLPPVAMLAGLAVTVVVVATTGTVKLTVTVPDEAPKPVLPP